MTQHIEEYNMPSRIDDRVLANKLRNKGRLLKITSGEMYIHSCYKDRKSLMRNMVILLFAGIFGALVGDTTTPQGTFAMNALVVLEGAVFIWWCVIVGKATYRYLQIRELYPEDEERTISDINKNGPNFTDLAS